MKELIMGTCTAISSNVFVYGSLLSDDVVSLILTRIPPSSPAILPHFQRFSVKGRVYPAITPLQHSQVLGRVLYGITPSELHILDEFEDYEYERKVVEVLLKDGSEKLQVNAYIWAKQDDPDLYGEWDFEHWKVVHKERFLKLTKEFKNELKEPNPKTRVETYESFYNGTTPGDSPNP